MLTRADIAKVASSFEGVPYRHQGRSRNGVDCAGLIIMTAWEAGVLDATWDFRAYRREPSGQEMHQLLQELAVRDLKGPRLGNIVMMSEISPRYPHHLGVLVQPLSPGRELGLVHAHATSRKVIVHDYEEFWRSKSLRFWDFPQVA